MSSVIKISEAASLGLHAAMRLTVSPDSSMTTREIAAGLRASEAHLAKVMQRLARAGLVRPTRGPKGGFRLARPASEIPLLEVYETIEGKFVCAACLLGEPVCDGKSCMLGGMMGAINERVYVYLRDTKLSDVAGGWSATTPKNTKKEGQE